MPGKFDILKLFFSVWQKKKPSIQIELSNCWIYVDGCVLWCGRTFPLLAAAEYQSRGPPGKLALADKHSLYRGHTVGIGIVLARLRSCKK